MKIFNDLEMKFSNLFTSFQDTESQSWLKIAFGANFLGVIGSWLAQNWYVFLGFIVASVIPMVMSWRKHNEEIRHMRIMNQIEEEKAKKALNEN